MEQNRFGICEWVFPERGPAAVARAARLGFDGIQIAEQGGYEAGFPLLDVAVQEEYRRTVDNTGITLQALHLWSGCRMPCMIHPVDSPCGRVGVTCVRAAVQACTVLGIPKIMITSGFMSQIKHEQDFQIFAQHLRLACQIAGEKGVSVVFESALTVPEIRRMREMVGPELKICYDVYNPIRFHMGKPWEEIPQLGLEAIDHFHMKDGPENNLGCTLLGDGIGHYQQVVREIRKLGYCGWFVTENYYLEPPVSWQGDFDRLAGLDLARMRAELGANR